MAVTITWPRHPRAGYSANSARATTISGKYWVQLRNTSNAYVNAMQVTTLKRAQDIAKRLNDLFANYPGADLDFITPSWENGCYVVAWSGTRAAKDGSIYDTIGSKNDKGIVYENLYSGCSSDHDDYPYRSRSNMELIASVTDADADLLGLPHWKIALQWANGIRSPINGWNCIKNSTQQSRYEKDVGLYIPKLVDPKDSCYTGNSRDVQATYYGCGELQPNVTTANNDIFHCCDLTVARPDSLEKVLLLNTWVKITNKNNGKSVVARVTDTCPTAALDLTAGGVAYALNCYNGTVTISKP